MGHGRGGCQGRRHDRQELRLLRRIDRRSRMQMGRELAFQHGGNRRREPLAGI
jgi:hypothetical protein